MGIGQVGMPIDFRMDRGGPHELRRLDDRQLADIGLERDGSGMIRESGKGPRVAKKTMSWFERLVGGSIASTFSLQRA